MTIGRRGVVALALATLAACGGTSPTATQPIVVAPTATVAPARTLMPSPTPDAGAQYSALAEAVNREWEAIGTPQSANSLSQPRRQQYVAQWYVLESEIVADLTTVSWPPSVSSEEASLLSAVRKLQTLLQPSGGAESYLGLIGYQPLNDQRSAAAALRVRLGLQSPGAADLI
jgi:hypothetical protein